MLIEPSFPLIGSSDVKVGFVCVSSWRFAVPLGCIVEVDILPGEGAGLGQPHRLLVQHLFIERLAFDRNVKRRDIGFIEDELLLKLLVGVGILIRCLGCRLLDQLVNLRVGENAVVAARLEQERTA